MSFISLNYLFLFIFAITAIHFVAEKWRQLLLLFCSYLFFITWKWEYAFLLGLSTAVDYICAILIEKSKDLKLKRMYLAFSLGVNLGILFCFKYYNFFIENIGDVSFHLFNIDGFLPVSSMLLPLGISFYTFQTISYTIDVYRGDIKAERNFISFALFVSFFPQLIAGPIERAGKLLPQLKRKPEITLNESMIGFSQILWGVFKKMVIADQLIPMMSKFYGGQAFSLTPLETNVSTVLMAVHLYMDFSAYSDIAIGSARLLGVKLSQNFDNPYFSNTFAESWRKWHITLTRWFIDYVYKPLLQSRVLKNRRNIAAIIVFMLIGFWHGAGWNFFWFGLSNGILLILERETTSLQKHIKKLLPLRENGKLLSFFKGGTIFYLRIITMIPFFIRSDKDIQTIYYNVFNFKSVFQDFFSMSALQNVFTLQGIGVSPFIGLTTIIFSIFVFSVELNLDKIKTEKVSLKRYISLFSFLFFLILFFGTHSEEEFIYFIF